MLHSPSERAYYVHGQGFCHLWRPTPRRWELHPRRNLALPPRGQQQTQGLTPLYWMWFYELWTVEGKGGPNHRFRRQVVECRDSCYGCCWTAGSYVTQLVRAKFWWSTAVLVLAWPAGTVGHGLSLAEDLDRDDKHSEIPPHEEYVVITWEF